MRLVKGKIYFIKPKMCFADGLNAEPWLQTTTWLVAPHPALQTFDSI